MSRKALATTGIDIYLDHIGGPVSPYVTSTDTVAVNGVNYGLYGGAHLISNGSPLIPVSLYCFHSTDLANA